jgi:integrase/recombinase XerD
MVISWKEAVDDFVSYLKIEKALSINTIEAYIRDLNKLQDYLSIIESTVAPVEVTSSILSDFAVYCGESGMKSVSQSRMLSGIRTFYKYLLMENLIETNPAKMIDLPSVKRKLPDVLSVCEIDMILAAIDLSKPEGQRNKAMIETMYSCGLRVSELVTLKISELHFKDKFIKIKGKGKKERLTPIGEKAIHEINLYLIDRQKLNVQKGHEDFLFLNGKGKSISRVMVFTIIKNLASEIGLHKTISPHTFRHSFATHLIEGGADLRSIQEMLGHKSILTTEIYTHLDRTFLRETIIEFHPRGKK